MVIPNSYDLKKAAAIRAVQYIEPGMVLGLGSGSTAELAVRHLALRVRTGLAVTGVPTSNRTADLARELGIVLTTLEDEGRIDLTIDGADEVLVPSLTSIKGLGGALLKEKLVALASDMHILIVDETKIVHTLGADTALPVEVVPFGWTNTSGALGDLGCETTRRSVTGQGNETEPYMTDSGNYVIDCKFPLIDDAAALGARIKGITGVVEHGLFIGLSTHLIISATNGIEIMERHSNR